MFFSKKNRIKEEKVEVWSGDYKTWVEAKNLCTGYEDENILEECKNALLKVKKGEAVYERDSVIFNEIQYSWGLLAGLQKTAMENKGKLCVLDFGGSLGSTYFQNRNFLSSVEDLKWCVVEQENFVDVGTNNFENVQLKFFHTVEECFLKYKPNVILLSGVLQYLENPYDWINKFISYNINTIIIDRTSFFNGENDIITLQNVPEEIYSASYPCWFFQKQKFLNAFKNYSVLGSYSSFCDPPKTLNSIHSATWEGFILTSNT